MKFGISYKHQNPRPWRGERSEHRLLSDRVGFDYLWEVSDFCDTQ